MPKFPVIAGRIHGGSPPLEEPIVITGMGLIASVGRNRESVWRAVRQGTSGIRRVDGLPGIPDGLLLGAPVDIEPERPGQLKVIALAKHAAAEAMADARVNLLTVDRERFACAISGHMGDTSSIPPISDARQAPPPNAVPWWEQWFPNTACWSVARHFGLNGPRTCHSTACASGLIDFISVVPQLRDGQCDIALAGSAECFHPLFAAGFRRMRVLAQHADPKQACRPFDRHRNGFVMGEGAAMFVVER